MPIAVPDGPYPRTALKLVACEITYALPPTTDFAASKGPVYTSLRKVYPIPGDPPSLELITENGLQRIAPSGYRYLNQERTASVSFSPTSLIVEDSDYTSYEDLAEAIAVTFGVGSHHLDLIGVNRVGLRYINEFDAAATDSSADRYFSAALLSGSADVDGLGRPLEYFSHRTFQIGEDSSIVSMRAGRTLQPTVLKDGPLRIAKPSQGEIFVLDLDASWRPPAAPVPVAPEDVRVILDDLHYGIQTLFETTITEQLRDEVLR